MENQPKIVLICGGPFSYRSISALAYENFLSGVVIGSSEFHIVDSLKKECEQSSVPFLSISESSAITLLEIWLNQIQPDAVFSVCFPFKVPKEILACSTIKFINFHTGPLPRYRGPMPIFEVIRKREAKTAMTAHFMNEMYDRGNIIYSESLSIKKDDTFSSLALKLSERCAIMVSQMAHMLQFGNTIPSTIQHENEAVFYPFPKETDLQINWKEMDAETIIALINACNGWNNGAVTLFDNESIHLITVHPFPFDEPKNIKPGTIIELFEDGSAEIACIQNQKIRINQFGTEDGLYTYDFLNQMGFKNGSLLG